jgi:hypothetical protein
MPLHAARTFIREGYLRAQCQLAATLFTSSRNGSDTDQSTARSETKNRALRDSDSFVFVLLSFLTIINLRSQLLIAHNKPKNYTITRMEDPESETEESSPPLQDTCIHEVTALFPDICLDYVQKIAGPLSFVPHEVINHLLDLQESGQAYQKAKRPKQTIGKRKRATEGQDDEDEDEKLQDRLSEAKRKYSNLEGHVIAPKSTQMATM